jgi:demethylmenaquinone methyltransferase / 2-methoxy-6-polyprenyl-1,4-benzoquinol methylase
MSTAPRDGVANDLNGASAPDASTAQSSSNTHFGFKTVSEEAKASHVAGVFHSVAAKYDTMNDLMSVGLHRAWKAFTVRQAAVRPGMKVLDVAGGTADLARAFAKRMTVGGELKGEVWLTDINGSMLAVGRDRMHDDGIFQPTVQCDGEKLPFPSRYFDLVTVAFGLRNMTHKDQALAEFRRVLKPGGKLLVLEFSKVWKPLEKPYDFYSFKILPRLGEKVAGDAASYQYLAESIRMHPDQETLLEMMKQAGLERCRYFNLSAGVVALHEGLAF